MVHGWTGRSHHDSARKGAFSARVDLAANKVGEADAARSLIGIVQDAGGASVYTFDYHAASARWVTDAAIAPKLAEAITCLSATHGHPAVIMAHSMGGNATRHALSVIEQSGSALADNVSDVVTFGTPNAGSWLASVVDVSHRTTAYAALFPGASAEAITAMRSLIVLCGTLTTGSLDESGVCSTLPDQISSAQSAAGHALQLGSAEIRSLARWPEGVAVHGLAGSIDLEITRLTWFRGNIPVGSVNTGDFVVGAGSATDNPGESRTVDCAYTLDVRGANEDNILEALKLKAANETRDNAYTSLTSWACFHGNLMRSIELTNEALGVIADVVDARTRRSTRRKPLR